MINLDFSFLKQRFPEIYGPIVSMLEYYYSYKYFDASIKLVEPLEILIKYTDRYFNSSTFVNSEDYADNFLYHINDLNNQGILDDEITFFIEQIWYNYDDLEGLENIRSGELEDLIIKFHKICK